MTNLLIKAIEQRSDEEWLDYMIGVRKFNFYTGITILGILAILFILTAIGIFAYSVIYSIIKDNIIKYMISIGYILDREWKNGKTIEYFKKGDKTYEVSRFIDNHYKSLKVIKNRHENGEL